MAEGQAEDFMIREVIINCVAFFFMSIYNTLHGAMTHRRTQNLPLAEVVPEAIYNLCLFIKAVLQKSCQNLEADSWLGYREN
jgi:hypothetical protein